MNKEKSVLFSDLNTIFAPDQKHQEQRALFLTSFRETFSEYCKEQTQQRGASFIAEKLFEQLFIHHDNDLQEHFSVIARLIRSDISLQTFFSSLFRIFLMKSLASVLENHEELWPELGVYSKQVEAFMNLLKGHAGSDNSASRDEPLIELETIMHSLGRIIDTGEKVVLLNSYQGVPIRFSATIIKRLPDAILVKANSMQLTAALLQQEVFILHNEMLTHDIHAHVKLYQQDQHNLLLLSNLNVLHKRVVARQAVRVYPKINHSITINLLDGTFHGEGTLMDVSIGGVALFTNDSLHFHVDQTIQLHFDEVLLGKSIVLKALLVFISTYDKGYRYHFKLMATAQQEKIISAYISQREKEIVKSLREYLI